ncbi:hypothetical protein AC578_8906 [Pseudocercospora eumusae]|uniref:F-box domain-containing protein n=1 Tax=Pseudocercospora eumusae TaxID=321146 RepID=A0A139HN76_9PEZI|nr:hypothetical protein AC578_8906 [Pseudocercospora eumusae]
MSTLLCLPTELLNLILEELGGRELRRSRQTGDGARWRAHQRLSICREWYASARPVYLSGLGTSAVRLYASNLQQLDDKLGYAGHRKLMHKNTRSMTIRLLGHFWDENFASECEHLARGDKGWDEREDRQNEMPDGFNLKKPECQAAMASWRDVDVAPRLDELFGDIHNFTALEELDFTASSDPDARGQDWDYIHLSTVLRLVRNLPLCHDLRSLTLDLCGTRLKGDDGSFHLCEELANVIPSVEDVRLRMINICPTIFSISNDVADIRLKSLVMKLHLPTEFEHTLDQTSEPCFQMRTFSNQFGLHEHLAQATSTFLSRLSSKRAILEEKPVQVSSKIPSHGLERLIISYPDSSTDTWEVCALNCLKMVRVTLNGHGYPSRDDGRRSWTEFAESGPEYEHLERVQQHKSLLRREMNLGCTHSQHRRIAV